MAVNQERLVNRFLELVQIDCESFKERQMADHITREYAKLGIHLTEDNTLDVTGCTAGNLYGVFPSNTESQDWILLSGHLDTVKPGIGKKGILHADGRITSDGTTVLGADDAAANAVILEAIQEIQEEGLPHRPVEILHTVAEEAYCTGAEAFDFSQIQAKEAYCLDLSDRLGSYSATEPTLIAFTIRVLGRAAHAGFEPEQGIHTIAAAAAAITRIRQGRPDPETTLNLGRIIGGTGTNIVPAETVVEGEIRSLNHEHALAVYDGVVAAFEEEAAAIGATVEAERRVRLHAYRITEDNPALLHYTQVLDALGIQPYGKINFGGSDMNRLMEHGISGITIFNSMHGCHTTEEYAVVEELVTMVEIVKLLLTT